MLLTGLAKWLESDSDYLIGQEIQSAENVSLSRNECVLASSFLWTFVSYPEVNSVQSTWRKHIQCTTQIHPVSFTYSVPERNTGTIIFFFYHEHDKNA